jgi:hypothetical protein
MRDATELILQFGPHKGETMGQVAVSDPNYIRQLIFRAQRADVRAATCRIVEALDAAADHKAAGFAFECSAIACVGIVVMATERSACPRCLEFEEEIRVPPQRLAASGQYVTCSPSLKRWLATSSSADAASGYRAGWTRLARFLGPRLREWESRWLRPRGSGCRSACWWLKSSVVGSPGE